MSSDVENLKSYCDLLREQQIALAEKLVNSSGGSDQIIVAVNNAGNFAALQSAIDTAKGILGELEAGG